jgi:hypothetical protein
VISKNFFYRFSGRVRTSLSEKQIFTKKKLSSVVISWLSKCTILSGRFLKDSIKLETPYRSLKELPHIFLAPFALSRDLLTNFNVFGLDLM